MTAHAQSTADVSPSSKMTFQEHEARQNFSNFMNDLVSKNGGEMGNKKETTADAVEKRAMNAI